MKRLFNFENEHVRIAFAALTFGGAWGFLEATLGTLLHLPFFRAGGMFLGSTAVMLPIAYFLLAGAYKETGRARTLLYVGLIAASIKLLALALPVSWGKPLTVINPAVSIVLESAFAGIFAAVLKPTKVLSLKSAGVMIAANLSWTLCFLGYHGVLLAAGNPDAYFPIDQASGAAVVGWPKLGSLLVSANYIANGYALIIGGIAALIGLILVKRGIAYPREKMSRIAFHPVAAPLVALGMIALAVTATFLVTAFPL